MATDLSNSLLGPDEIWLVFIITFVFLTLIFTVLRRDTTENYKEVPKLPKFNSSQKNATTPQNADYQELSAPSVPMTPTTTPPAIPQTSFAGNKVPTRPVPQGTAKKASVPATPKNTYIDEQDLQDPDTYTQIYRPNIPVTLRHPQHKTADMYRGDIYIENGPAKRGWFDSRYDDSARKTNTLFGEQGARQYLKALDRHNVAYKGNVANEELVY